MRINPLHILAALFMSVALVQAQPEMHVDHTNLKKFGWQQALATSSFKDLSLDEIIETAHKLDVHHLALSPGQSLSADHKDQLIDYNSPPDQIDALAAKLKEIKVDVVSFHMTKQVADIDEVQKIFAFAKKLKIKNIVCEPQSDSLEDWQKLADDNKVNLVIPAKYADVAAWRKAGKDPLAEIKKMNGQILEVNFQAANNDDIAAVTAELKKENFKGIITVGIEPATGADAVNQLAATINAFNAAVTKAAAEN